MANGLHLEHCLGAGSYLKGGVPPGIIHKKKGFSTINHPLLGTLILGNPHLLLCNDIEIDSLRLGPSYGAEASHGNNCRVWNYFGITIQLINKQNNRFYSNAVEYMIYLDFIVYIYIHVNIHMYTYIYIYTHDLIHVFLVNYIYIYVISILMWTFATARCILHHCTHHGPHLHFCLQAGTGEVSSQFEWYHPPLQAANVAANFSACDRQNRGRLRNLTETTKCRAATFWSVSPFECVYMHITIYIYI